MTYQIFQDVIVKYNRLRGKQVHFVPRFSYQNIHHQQQRQNVLQKHQEQRTKQLIAIGNSFDETEIVSSMDTATIRQLRQMLYTYIQQGKIAQEYTISYRDKQKQTTIPNEEVIWKHKPETAYNIRYFVDTKNITLIVTTTNPTTIFGDVAIAVHPEDRRYKKLIGHKAIIPIINKVIPIIGDRSVDTTQNQ